MKRIVVMVLGVVLALAAAAPVALAQVGQGSKASGTADELAAAWWQWALSKPATENPLVGSYEGGEQCDGQPVTETKGKKRFLAGSLDGNAVERTCTVPVGTQLFFPVGNAIYINTEPTDNEQVARDWVNGFMEDVLTDPGLSVVVTVDGKEVKSNRLVRAQTALFTVTLPEDNLFSAYGVLGDYDAVADGLWAALPPLSKGEHTIHFQISAPSVGFSQDNTYHLTVQ